MGPLSGLKIIELGGIGPGPFCGMLLADMGADVLRIERIVANDSGVKGMDPRFSLLHRGRPAVAMDLKAADARVAVKRLITHADALTEGFRPGVERGHGPPTLSLRFGDDEHGSLSLGESNEVTSL